MDVIHTYTFSPTSLLCINILSSVIQHRKRQPIRPSALCFSHWFHKTQILRTPIDLEAHIVKFPMRIDRDVLSKFMFPWKSMCTHILWYQQDVHVS